MSGKQLGININARGKPNTLTDFFSCSIDFSFWVFFFSSYMYTYIYIYI